MDKEYIIFQEDGLFGAKDQRGKIIIQPQYMEMQPFSCGLSLVRNHQYQYAYELLTTNKLFLLANILGVTHNLLAGFLV